MSCLLSYLYFFFVGFPPYLCGLIVLCVLLCIRGYGTYVVNDQVLGSVAGAVERVNKLIFVQPLKSR